MTWRTFIVAGIVAVLLLATMLTANLLWFGQPTPPAPTPTPTLGPFIKTPPLGQLPTL